MCLKRENGSDSVRVRRENNKILARLVSSIIIIIIITISFSSLLPFQIRGIRPRTIEVGLCELLPERFSKIVCMIRKSSYVFSRMRIWQPARWWDENTWDFQLELILQLWNVLQKEIFGLKTWDSFHFLLLRSFFISFLVERRRIRYRIYYNVYKITLLQI